MQPYDYQQKIINEVLSKFSTNNRLLLQGATGLGKTAVFSFIASKFRKTLILCHRIELVQQSIDTLNKIGMTAQEVNSKTKSLHEDVDVYVGMVQTVYNRLNKGRFHFDVDLVISDECHRREFEKVYDFFPMQKILGATATPIVNEKIKYWKCKTCKHEQNKFTEECDVCSYPDLEEWKKPFKLSDIYEDIVLGPPINDLIEIGQLVPDIPMALSWGDSSALKEDGTGDFSKKSLDAGFGNDETAIDVIKNYNEFAKGKRTLVFNPSTKSNKLIYEKFIDEGIDCRMYDLTNTPEADRTELVHWFKNTEGAVLLSVGVFTTGFDAKNVECIILNRPTLSLSLYIQMVGRGGRACEEIYKPNFLLIDGGGNIERFGVWHEDKHDWRKIFFNGKGKPKKVTENDVIDVKECGGCGALIPKSESSCSLCGKEEEKKQINKEGRISDKLVKPIIELPPPNAKKIIDYTLRSGENIHFGFKLLYSQIVDLFKYYRVSKDVYEKTLDNGKLDKRVSELVKAVYFPLINEPKFRHDTNRTLSYVISKTKEKIKKYYDKK